MESKVLTKDVKEGDIYYFLISGHYYFLQIIKICIDLDTFPQRKFRYFVIVFERSYRKMPKRNEPDFKTIYEIKYKPKNTLLYVILSYETAELKIIEYDAAYKERNNYSLHYWGNEKVRSAYTPEIIMEDAVWTENDKGILITPSAAHIGYIFSRIEQDIKHKNKKLQKISPKYFSEWLNEIDIDIIIKIEKIVTAYENNCNENTLKNCIQGINKLDEKEHFVGTIERENIFDKIVEIGKNNMLEEVVEKIINETRDW
ncbi:hypothetical protein ACYULU_10860 [Breznakiellaceae bacterium SP9]